MNNRKSTSIILWALTAVIVFLHFYLTIYKIHFFGLFYDFSSDITSLKSMINFSVLIGGLTYIIWAFLRLRNGNMPIVMIVLPLLSILLYFIFGNDTLGIALPFIIMIIQFVIGVIPTILWVIVEWILRLLPFPHFIHMALSFLVAVILSTGTAFLLNRKLKYKRKKIIKTRRGKHTHSSIHTNVTSEPGQPLYQQTSDESSGEEGKTTENANSMAMNQQENTGYNIYEKHGYNLSGQILWNGNIQNGSCSIDLSLLGRSVPDHAYHISGSGWESSDSLSGVLQINAVAEAVDGKDRYDISGTIYYDASSFARMELFLSNDTQSISYSIKGEINNFSATQSGSRHVHLIFENQQNQNVFYAEGSYDTNGLPGNSYTL